MAASWPPVFQPAWLVTGTLSVATFAVALAAAHTATRTVPRFIAGIAVVLGLVALSVPARYYRETYHDYPLALAPIALVLPVACWFCRLRPLALFLGSGTGLFLFYALIPPQGDGVMVVRSGGLTMTMHRLSEDGAGWTLDVRGPPGQDLSRRFDLDRITVQGDVGPFTPVTCWSPTDNDPEDEPKSMNRTSRVFRAFVPRWTRSWNARVVLPTWPTNIDLYSPTRRAANQMSFDFPRLPAR